MLSRYAAKNPDRMLRVGLIAIVLANVASYVLQRKSGLPESVTDPLTGFAYGVAIMTLLLGVYFRGRAQRQGASRS